MPLNKILLVDDEPDIRQVAEIALETVGGFQVELCDSGESALERVDNFAPDLILLDVMMPAMDGPSTLQRLRSQASTAEIPIVFMTAKSQQAEIQALLDLGALSVLPKPFDPMTLAEDVNKLWLEHHG